MRLALALILLVSCAPLCAHDFWIEPSAFRPAAGATIAAALRVGEHFKGEPVPRRTPRIASFIVRDARGEREVHGVENRHPAGVLRIDGPAVIGYRGKPYPHEISAAKFAEFLREEGIGNVRPRGEGVQRERFQRFAKSIVGSATADTRLGWPFELVRDGDRFQLLHEQKPLRGAMVFALSRDGRRMSARTDANGFVAFALTPGVWLIKAVHVVASGDGGYDWDSYWASLTLER